MHANYWHLRLHVSMLPRTSPGTQTPSLDQRNIYSIYTSSAYDMYRPSAAGPKPTGRPQAFTHAASVPTTREPALCLNLESLVGGGRSRACRRTSLLVYFCNSWQCACTTEVMPEGTARVHGVHLFSLHLFMPAADVSRLRCMRTNWRIRDACMPCMARPDHALATCMRTHAPLRKVSGSIPRAPLGFEHNCT